MTAIKAVITIVRIVRFEFCRETGVENFRNMKYLCQASFRLQLFPHLVSFSRDLEDSDQGWQQIAGSLANKMPPTRGIGGLHSFIPELAI